jgi:uncharacterized protein (DUF2141 family)
MLNKKSDEMKSTVGGFVRIQHQQTMKFQKKIMFAIGIVCSFIVLLGCDQQPTQKPILSQQAESTISSQNSQATEEIVAALTSRGTPLKLIVEVDGFANDKGNCRVAVYMGKAHFNDLEYAIAKESTSILDSKAQANLEIELPAVKDSIEIAVCAYHDENNNSRLDKNSFGIPIERYGFSSNPKRGFGPPKFNEAAIDLGTANVQNESGAMLVIPITVK